MTLLYGAVGAVGYQAKGSAIQGIIIFNLGHSPRVRFAAACILVQATSQVRADEGVPESVPVCA